LIRVAIGIPAPTVTGHVAEDQALGISFFRYPEPQTPQSFFGYPKP